MQQTGRIRNTTCTKGQETEKKTEITAKNKSWRPPSQNSLLVKSERS